MSAHGGGTGEATMTTRRKKQKQSRSRRAGVQFPVARVHRQLRQANLTNVRVDAAVCLAAVMEYLTAEIVDLASTATRPSVMSTALFRISNTCIFEIPTQNRERGADRCISYFVFQLFILIHYIE